MTAVPTKEFQIRQLHPNVGVDYFVPNDDVRVAYAEDEVIDVSKRLEWTNILRRRCPGAPGANGCEQKAGESVRTSVVCVGFVAPLGPAKSPSLIRVTRRGFSGLRR